MTSLERDVRFLKRYAIVTTTMLAVLSVAAFTRSSRGNAKLDEIDVERINIREPNGNYRMVISNRPRSIGRSIRTSRSDTRAAHGRASSSSTTRARRTAD
jgi:hypothetical protein